MRPQPARPDPGISERRPPIPRCADGGRVHDFRGQSRCPGCGWGGLSFDRIELVPAPSRLSLAYWRQEVPGPRWIWWGLWVGAVLGLINDVLAGRGIFG